MKTIACNNAAIAILVVLAITFTIVLFCHLSFMRWLKRQTNN